MLFLLFTCIALSLSLSAQKDSTLVTEWEDKIEETVESNSEDYHHNRQFPFDFNFDGNAGAFVIVTMGIMFGIPVVIVFIAFFFQYRNRKARYRLAEQALAAGQPIPEEFIKNREESDTLAKGIKNIFVGLGLFIFLWSMVGFSIGTIGLLVMFTGFAQVIIYYATNGKK